MSQDVVTIIDRGKGSGEPVEAVLHRELSELQIIDAETDWSPVRLKRLRELRERGIVSLPQHVHWNWALKAISKSYLLAYRFLGIEVDGKMQGMMAVNLVGGSARVPPDLGKPLAYVDFIETAPWNAKEFSDSPQYGGVGIRLIQSAVQLSLDEGFAGRVGLHALSQAEAFYRDRCQMECLGPDLNYGGLHYFELTAAQAATLLEG